MSNPTFADFTLEASPSLTDYVVGYRTAVSGGERRTTLQSTADLFAGSYFGSLTANRLLFGQGNDTLGASDLTYSSPTLSVPDAFNISSAGSIALTAGGSNKNIALLPSGTGITYVNQSDTPDSAAKFVVGVSGASSPVVSVSYGGNATFRGFAASGTKASPTNTALNQTLGGLTGGGYFNGALSSSSKGYVFIVADAAWTDTGAPSAATPTRIEFGVTPAGSTTAFNPVSVMSNGSLFIGANRTRSAWLTLGAMLDVRAVTLTDNSSSGTVASQVGSAFGIPTFAASSATTYTNAANVYIAGDVATTGNASATNSYGLWNVGKTRLDGAVVMTPQALSGAGAVNVTSPSTFFTSTGGAQALTLANGIAGQMKTIVHVVDGGSGVLTPTSKIGFTTITFTNVGDSCTLQYTAQGWAIVGIFGAVAA